MRYLQKSPFDCTVEELDRELLARGAHMADGHQLKYPTKTPGDEERKGMMMRLRGLYDSAESFLQREDLKHISTEDLVKTFMYKLGKIEINGARGTWGKDDRLDYYDIVDERAKLNTQCTAAIFMEQDMRRTGNDSFTLNLMNYGSTYNLCPKERFHSQPIAAGPMCTGFLVREDVIATAAHFVNDINLRDLRFVFDYKITNEKTLIENVSDNNIYRGVKILQRAYHPEGDLEDWALVQLDRDVTGRHIPKLADCDACIDDSVYVLGYPVGLPLKYAPDAVVRDTRNTYFVAELDIYSGNSGSPVFDGETHEIVGMVVRGDSKDFRWTGECWISVVYNHPVGNSEGAHCTLVSKFRDFINTR